MKPLGVELPAILWAPREGLITAVCLSFSDDGYKQIVGIQTGARPTKSEVFTYN